MLCLIVLVVKVSMAFKAVIVCCLGNTESCVALITGMSCTDLIWKTVMAG